MDEKLVSELKAKAREIRRLTLESIGHLGVGHVGGAMSVIDILTLLYNVHMDVDPANPNKEDRDRLILSKGHAGPALYATLAHQGFFPVEWLQSLNIGGTRLPSHCDRNRTPGIDMTTGSLGMGLSAGVGMALANRLNGSHRMVYVILGDGECNEGQIWEAAMCASHFNLENLIAIVDYNKMQIDGYTHEIMELEDFPSKWRAFGWHAIHVDGHDFQAMDAAIKLAKGNRRKPTAVILDTIKGKGASFCEGQVGSHNLPVTMDMVRDALARLNAEAN